MSSSKSTKIPQENIFFFKKQTFNIFDDQRKVARESVLSVWKNNGYLLQTSRTRLKGSWEHVPFAAGS